jgi:hypothetical protein
MATFTTLSNGQQIATDGPALHLGFKQTGIPGGVLNAASQKTITGFQQQAAAAKALGAGQKGSSRRRRRYRKRGGAALNLNANIPDIPTANSIPGVSHANTHIASVNNLNNARWSGIYDKTINMAPIQVKGGTKKRKSKSKRRHGRRSNRTHRRNRH